MTGWKGGCGSGVEPGLVNGKSLVWFPWSEVETGFHVTDCAFPLMTYQNVCCIKGYILNFHTLFRGVKMTHLWIYNDNTTSFFFSVIVFRTFTYEEVVVLLFFRSKYSSHHCRKISKNRIKKRNVNIWYIPENMTNITVNDSLSSCYSY